MFISIARCKVIPPGSSDAAWSGVPLEVCDAYFLGYSARSPLLGPPTAFSAEYNFAGDCLRDLFKDFSLRCSEFVDAVIQSNARKVGAPLSFPSLVVYHFYGGVFSVLVVGVSVRDSSVPEMFRCGR